MKQAASEVASTILNIGFLEETDKIILDSGEIDEKESLKNLIPKVTKGITLKMLQTLKIK